MDSTLADYFGNWVDGLKTMTFLHNLIVSILLYMARQHNMSNVLKIIFNFSGLLHQLFTFGLNMLPLEIPLSMCRGVAYSQSVSNFFLKETLAIFLLWRLRQIEHRESDKWISLFLFFVRTIAQFAQIVSSNPTISFIGGISVCVPVNTGARIFVWIVIACDFLIDLYVTTRLVRVLRRANRNAAQISSNIERKTKRTLFTAVMYWNFLRLAIAFVTSVLSSLYFELFPASNYTHQAADLGIFGGFTIIMSYVITVDAEIVRVIEGKPKKGSDSSEKSISEMSYKQQSSLSSHNPPKYSSSIKQEEDDVVVSMTRLSFFEWANMVVGFRRDKNNNEREFNEEDIKEIIEGSSNDLERGSSQDNNNKRQSSNLSDGTAVSVEKR